MNRIRNYLSNSKVTRIKCKPVETQIDLDNKHALKNESFHESMKFVLSVSQCFSVMPLYGIWSDNLSLLTTKLLSFRTIAALAFIVLNLFELFLSIGQAIALNFNLYSVAAIIFLIETSTGAILLFHLAHKWAGFMKYWAAREDCFLNAPYKENGMRLKFKIKLVASTLFVLALVEHLLSHISGLEYDYNQYVVCKIRKIGFMQFHFYKVRSHVFRVLPYNFAIIIVLLWLTLSSTFCWNFIDILIIMISIGLTKRFNQLNDRVMACYEKPFGEMFWIEMREHFVKLIQIKEIIDTNLAYIILLSCTSNLYSICFQLYNSFNDIPFIWNKIYFWFSLAYLIMRTFCVFYFAALVCEASKKPIQVLRNFPTKLWNTNIQRFLDLVTNENVMLSGNQFFYLTKGMILGMIGTIITYELVLIQEANPDSEKAAFCNITRFNLSTVL